MLSPSQTSDLTDSQRGAWLSIAAYVLLTACKLGAGWWSGSRGLVADGINNLTDVIGSVAVLLGLRIAVRPADADHRYGHQKAESVAAVVVAAVMGLIGLDVAVTAARAVYQPDLRVPHAVSLWVGLLSAAAMFAVYSYNIRLARRTGSKALAAAAYDNRSDAFTSLGSAVGVIGAQFGWRWTDPLAGFVIALIILRTAWHIGSEAAHTLMDGFDVDALQRIREQVSRVGGVTAVRELRARYLGNTVAVEVTICVGPSLTIVEAHHVSEQVEQRLHGFMSIAHVHVHVEPASAADVRRRGTV